MVILVGNWFIAYLGHRHTKPMTLSSCTPTVVLAAEYLGSFPHEMLWHLQASHWLEWLIGIIGYLVGNTWWKLNQILMNSSSLWQMWFSLLFGVSVFLKRMWKWYLSHKVTDCSFNWATLSVAEMCLFLLSSLLYYISCKLQIWLCFPLGLFCHSLDLVPCSLSTFFPPFLCLIHSFAASIPRSLSPFLPALYSLFLDCSQHSACVGSWVLLSKNLSVSLPQHCSTH